MVYECGDLLGESERFPDGPRRTVVDVDLDRIRQERLRQGTFDDNRRGLDALDRRRDVPRRSRSTSTPPTGDIGLRRKVDRFPFVPDDAERLALDCYEAYNIQVSGLEQRLAGDRPAEGRHRRQRRPRLDARADRRGQGDGPARPPAQRHPRVHDAGLRDRRDHEVATPPGCPRRSASPSRRSTSSRPREQMLDDLDHPFADGEPVYDVTFENVQAGLRYDYLFRLANHRGGIVLGTGDLVRARARLVHVRRRRPDVALQRQRRRPEDADPAPDPLGDRQRPVRRRRPTRCSRRSSSQEITPELIPTVEGEKPQATEDSVGPYALQDFTLFHVLRRGYRPSKIAFLAWHAWRDADAGEWPPGYPAGAPGGVRPRPTIRHWLEVFCRRFFASQFKRSALPNGPEGERRRHDVARAATGGCRPTRPPRPGSPSSRTSPRRDRGSRRRRPDDVPVTTRSPRTGSQRRGRRAEVAAGRRRDLRR